MNDINIINNGNLWITRARAIKKRIKYKTIKDNRASWYKLFKFGSWRIYITKNIKMKVRNKRDETRKVFNVYAFRKHCYERSGHRCEICGKYIAWDDTQLHHILPFNRFPHLSMDERNMQILCRDCHKEIHCDPYKEIRQIESKAKELGINLKDYYDI